MDAAWDVNFGSVAQVKDRQKMICMLLEYGADPLALNYEGKTPLQVFESGILPHRTKDPARQAYMKTQEYRDKQACEGEIVRTLQETGASCLVKHPDARQKAIDALRKDLAARQVKVETENNPLRRRMIQVRIGEITSALARIEAAEALDRDREE
jgi:hypothetical protein